ncbi:MAG TPA: type II toxin-antitoxin system VapC family toxin [Gemmataceae bacterium]|jgi:tRNA(fMet)-specific endonuclease VapC
MSLYALDTDMLSLWQHSHPVVSQRIAARQPDELSVTVITVQEQLDGWHARLPRARTPTRIADLYRRLAETVRFLSRLEILHYTEAAIRRYGHLRKQCPAVGRMDLRIGATALEHGAIVVTRNLTDFRRIPGLQCEDWSQ